MIVIEWLTALTQNAVFEVLHNGTNSLIEIIKTKRLMKSLRLLIEEFCKRNECQYINSSAFEYYMKHNRVMEQVVSRALSLKITTSNKEFIQNQVKLARDIAKAEDEAFSYQEERLIKDLLKSIYEKVNDFFCKSISQDRRVELSKVLQEINEVKENLADVKTKSEEHYNQLMKSIDGLSRLSDIYAKPIAEMIFSRAKAGKINEIETILPLIQGKSDDLDIFCEFILNYWGNKDTKVEISRLAEIKCDFVRCLAIKSVLPIMVFREEPLKRLSDINISGTLFEIVEMCINDNTKDLFPCKIENDNGLSVHNYTLHKRFVFEEKWLMMQLFIIHLYKLNIRNVNDLMRNMHKDNASCLTELLIADKDMDAISNEVITDMRQKKAEEVLASISSFGEAIKYLCDSMQVVYYSILVKEKFINGNIKDASGLIPKKIEDCRPLSDFRVQIRIEEGCISLNELKLYCEEHNTFWLLNNYLIQEGRETLIHFCRTNESVFENDIPLFFIFMEALRATGNIVDELSFLNRYKDKFGHYFEFWNEYLQVDFSKNNNESLVEVCKEGRIEFFHPASETMLIERLLNLSQFDLAEKYIKGMELKGGNKFKIKKYSAYIEQQKGNQVKAICLLKEAFNLDQNDAYIVDNLITLSLLNNRTVDNRYIIAAEAIGTARMYSVVAGVRYTEGNIKEARRAVIKAILRSDPDECQAYGQYLSIETESKNNSERKIIGAEEDTVVYALSDKGMIKSFCIYEDNLLPKKLYQWNGDWHMYIDCAAEIGLIRKRTGDSFVFIDEKFIIKEIAPLDSYYFRMSVGKLEKQGTIKTLRMPEKGVENTTEFFAKWIKDNTPDEKDSFQWIEQYNNLADVPLPLFMYKRFSRVSYSQFISLVLEDKNIFIREGKCKASQCDKYILSFAAIWLLFKIGFSAEEVCANNGFITESARNQIVNEAKQLIKEYDRDTVASIGVYDGQLVFNETNEEKKQTWINEAGQMICFCEKLRTISNDGFEVTGGFLTEIDTKELLGVSDYDAVVIAQNENNCALVSLEAFLTSLANNEVVGLNCVTLIDWMIYCNFDAVKTIEYIEKMIQFGCVCSISKELLMYISTQAAKTSDAEMIYLKWDKALKKIDLLTGKVKDIAVMRLGEVYGECYREELSIDRNIMSILVADLFLLKRQKLIITLGANGTISPSIVSLGEEEAHKMLSEG